MFGILLLKINQITLLINNFYLNYIHVTRHYFYYVTLLFSFKKVDITNNIT